MTLDFLAQQSELSHYATFLSRPFSLDSSSMLDIPADYGLIFLKLGQ